MKKATETRYHCSNRMKIDGSQPKKYLDILAIWESLKEFCSRGINYKKGPIFVAVIVVLLIAYTIACLYMGSYIVRTRRIRAPISKAAKSIKNSFRTIWTTVTKPQIDKVHIDIPHENFQKIAYQREIALVEHLNDPSTNEYVNAKITADGVTAKIKMRLKGIFGDHWKDPEIWSYRVKVDGDKAIYGLKHFSLMSPRTRKYIYEWLFLTLLKDEDILGLRYKLVDLDINGKSKGTYLLEEHYAKQLIESSNRRDGPIVGFNKDFLIREWHRDLGSITTATSFESRHIDGSQTGDVEFNSEEHAMFVKAASLLDAFRRGEMTVAEVFDIKRLATFLAVKTVFSSSEFDPNDTKFYYNPITSKLEPIGAEVHFGAGGIASWSYNQESSRKRAYYNKLFFDDVDFFKLYVRELERLSEKSYLRKFFKKHQEEYKRNLKLLYNAFPDFDFSEGSLYHNQESLRKTLDPVQGLFTYLKDFSVRETLDEIASLDLLLASIQELPVEVLEAKYAKSSFSLTRIIPSDNRELVAGVENIAANKVNLDALLLPAKNRDGQVHYTPVRVTLPDDMHIKSSDLDDFVKKLKIRHRVLGLEKTYDAEVFPWSYTSSEILSQDFMRELPKIGLANLNFISIDDLKREIKIKAGSWTVASDIVFPRAYTVIAGPNTHLKLINKAKIVSFSPLNFRGSEGAEIIIESDGGQGLAVMAASKAVSNARVRPRLNFYSEIEELEGDEVYDWNWFQEKDAVDKSYLEYVVFKGLSNLSVDGWTLTGAVNFYESDVEFHKVKFLDAQSEDSLNVIRSHFRLDDCFFDGTFSDALDVDFGVGSVVNSEFMNLGNDAIDVSGTEIEVNNTVIKSAGDKGFSAGENSYMQLSGITIQDSEIAIVSKDFSRVTAKNISVQNSKVAFVIFQKKAEFGPASINASDVKFEQVEEEYLLEKNSRLILEGKKIEDSKKKKKVEDLLYGVQYGKKTVK